LLVGVYSRIRRANAPETVSYEDVGPNPAVEGGAADPDCWVSRGTMSGEPGTVFGPVGVPDGDAPPFKLAIVLLFTGRDVAGLFLGGLAIVVGGGISERPPMSPVRLHCHQAVDSSVQTPV